MSPGHSTTTPSQRLLISGLLVALVGLSWSGILERDANTRLSATLERALVTAALARGLNGMISVAQGTEIAVQPMGVGITITAGQILDPLNDLVERFSWLALVASASLGTQLLLTEIAAEPLVSMLLTATAVLTLVVLWWPRPVPGYGLMIRLLALVLFARFLFTMVGLTVAWVDAWVLESRQESAMTELTTTRDDIVALQADRPAADTTESSIAERFEAIIDDGRQLLDLEARLDVLREKAETAIGQLLELSVLFFVQTLLVPIGALWLSFASFRWFLRWLGGSIGKNSSLSEP